MRREMLEPFKGQRVKLVFKYRDFVIYGHITEVFEDAILFSTNQKTSLISFENIGEITPTVDKYGRG